MRKNMSILAKAAVIVMSTSITFSAYAVEILFAHVSDKSSYATPTYYDDGSELAGYVNSLAGYNVTIRDLNAAVYNDYANFDQVWVYDLNTGLNNDATQAANYTNIGAWYNNLGTSQQNLIVDGRIISSAWANETTWIQNYALELMDNSRTGGLMLGTDHNAYVDGINEINAAIGVALFTGNVSSSQAVVDPLSSLYTAAGVFPCSGSPSQDCIWDNSSPSYVPTGLQSNGQTLTPVAYHGTTSNAWNNAAVAATMGSETFGTCGNPGQPVCDNGNGTSHIPEPATLALLGLGLTGLGFTRRKKV